MFTKITNIEASDLEFKNVLNNWFFILDVRFGSYYQLTLIYAAVGLYDTHSLNGLFSFSSYVQK